MANARRPNRRRKKEALTQSEAVEVSTKVPLRARFRVFSERCRRLAGRLRGAFFVGLRWAFVLGVLAGLYWGYQLLDKHARTSETFTLRKVDLRGNSRVERDTLLRWAELHRKSNIFDRSSEQIEERLVEHPWVASARVRRDLPDALHIEVSEHSPLALILLDAPYLFSTRGVPFKVHELGDPSDLTVLTGVDEKRLRAEPNHGAELAQQVELLFSTYRAAGLWKQEPIGEIHFAADGGIRLVVGEPAMEILLSDGLPLGGLRDLRRVLDDMQAERKALAQVFVHEPGAAERRTGRGQRITVRYR